MLSENFINRASQWLSFFDEPGLGYQAETLQALEQELLRQRARITELEQEQAASIAHQTAQIETESWSIKQWGS
ncbi:MAG: hypothetical protein AB8B81_07920 [Halioglobus sp.]